MKTACGLIAMAVLVPTPATAGPAAIGEVGAVVGVFGLSRPGGPDQNRGDTPMEIPPLSPDRATPAPTFPTRRLALLALVLAVAATAAAVAMYGFGRAPDWALLARQPTVVHIHVGAAMTALVVGTIQLVGIKGTGLHRVIGWTWVIAMLAVAISSFFIRQINSGSFSWIHLLSGWTLIAVPMALYAIRRGQVGRHGQGMVWTFIGGLIIAGAFTFLPGRLMWAVFFR